MSVLYIMPMSMQKIRFVGLTVWSPIGNIQTDRQTYIQTDFTVEMEDDLCTRTLIQLFVVCNMLCYKNCCTHNSYSY